MKIEITFRKWTKLRPAKINHTLCIKGDGSESNKIYTIHVPRETYIENMLMAKSSSTEPIESKFQKVEIVVGLNVSFVVNKIN